MTEFRINENLVPDLMTVSDGARMVGIHRSRLRRIIARDLLPTTIVGGIRFVRKSQLTKLVEEKIR